MDRKTKPLIYRTVHSLNKDSVAHAMCHIFLGFAAAHLLAWFHWIYVFSALLIIVSFKELFVDAYLYEHDFDKQIFDILHYVFGFVAYILWIYFVQIADGDIIIQFPF